MVSKLHEKNMRCTLWVHPFTNIDSVNFVSGTNNGFWVLDSSGQHPGLTSWWNGKNAGDFFIKEYNNITNINNYVNQQY